jgi:hypothetical protein
MDLYIQPSATLEKSAAEVALPEDANAWPNEILQELFKQVPYIADFDPQVVMDKVDAERGYGFGHVGVQNKSEVQQGLSPEQMRVIGIQQVRIPVIIKDRKLMPFDVLVTADSRALPLTEGRLRQALFRPQAFDVTGRTPGDMSMVGQLYPPYRQNYGFGGGGMVGQAGMGKAAASGGELPTQDHFHAKLEKVLGLSPADVAKLKGQKTLKGKKTASAAGVPNAQATLPTTNTIKSMTPNLVKAADAPIPPLPAYKRTALESFIEKAEKPGKVLGAVSAAAAAAALGHHLYKKHKEKTGSILEAILPTIEVADYVAFTDRFDKSLQAAYVKNAHATHDAIQRLFSFEPNENEWAKTSSVLDNLTPSIVQLRKEAEGYSVKQASHRAWAPSVEEIDRGEAVKRFGEKVVLAADLSGSVTMTDGEGVQASPEENRAELISGYGFYRVKSTDGTELSGFVFPNLFDTNGTPLPIALFTDGVHAAVQEAIVGERLTEDVPELPLGDTPQGHGCFVRVLNGACEATIPFTVKAGYASVDTQQYQVETYDGRQMMLSVQDGGGLKIPQEVDGVCLIPADFVWLSLGDKEEVELVSELGAWGQQKEAMQQLASVVVRAGSDNSFTLESPYLAKIARDERSFISLDDALFLLGGLGTDLTYATSKLAEAIATQKPVTVKVGRRLVPMKEALDGAVAAYGAKLASMPVVRQDLVKEAAYLPDPVAVDTVLSLGFINPENITTFVGYLPQIDKVQERLCELLIAARLGLQDIPVPALEKCIRALEETIEGLKTLAFTRS